jgi:hypothetical protein
MAAGLIGSDAYTAGLHWGEPVERPGTSQEVAAAVVAEIEAQYDVIDWRATVARIRA